MKEKRVPRHAGSARAIKRVERRADQEARIVSAETLFNEGQTLAAEWTEGSLRKALERFSGARFDWKSGGDLAGEVRALNVMGEIFIRLSEHQEALEAFKQALALSKTPVNRAKALNGLSWVSLYLGDEKKALSYSERANQLSQEAKDYQGQAESRVNMGEVYYFLGENQRALQTIDQALTLWPDHSWAVRSRALIDKGYIYFDLRDMDQALGHYEQALTQSRNWGDRRGEALALTALGAVYSYLGNKQTALDYHNQAVTLFRTMGDRNGEGVTLNGLGYVYRNLGENQKSLDCYLQALQLFQILGNREYETFAITRVGKAYEGLGNKVKALEYHWLVLERAVVYSQTRAHSHNSIGTILQSMGQPAAALDHYKQSLQLFRATGDKMGEASTLNSVGRVYSSLGEMSKALHVYQQALAISRAVRDRREEVAVLFNIAETQRDARNYYEARQRIEDSLRIIELLRTEVASTALRTSYFASVRQHYELYIDILMHLHNIEPHGRFAEEAFAASEKARARSLLELLGEAQAAIRQGVDPGLLQQERELQKELNSRAERHRQLIAGNQTEAASVLTKEIDRLSIQYNELEAQVRLKSPRFAALTQPQPLPLNDIKQRVLDDDSLLLEYSLGDERSYLWAVTRNEVTSYQLPGRAEIEVLAQDAYNLLTASQPVSGETFEQRQIRVESANGQLPLQIEKLSKVLIEPVASKLGSKRLLIVPDGALQYIPFQILTKPTGTSGTNAKAIERIPLVADHEIVNEPSASALALLLSETTNRKPAANAVAVLADPVFESDDPRVSSSGTPTNTPVMTVQVNENEARRALRDVGLAGGDVARIPRLLASRDEADAIMSVTPWRSGFSAMGFDASRATAMKSDLADYRIVHFATHGLLNNEHPELSGIVLSLVDKNGQPQDGFLRLHDIYNLKLPVDLVVLSACSTGLGKDVKGEGLIGLTRGFMYAGAGSVVASLWKVDDEATAELMRYFYGFMLKDGLPPAAALRKAQLKMLQQKRWQSPYYWSGFIIQGQYTQNWRPGDFNGRWVVLVGSVAAVLGIAAFFALRRRRRSVL